MTTTPVYVAGNATIHAGRQAGTYASGLARYRTLCGRPRRNDRHDPIPTGLDAAITCQSCLRKLEAR